MRGSTPLVAVVVTFNRLPQLRQTLAALLAHPPEVLGAVVVVDNASTDGSADWLGSCLDARLRVERLARNVGGAGGFAHGLARAQAVYDPEWIVVMDDDARPAPGALAQFQTMLRQGALQGLDAVAAAVRHPDGRICRMNRPTVSPFWHGGVFLRTLLGGGRAAFHLADAAYAEGGLRPVDGASFVGLFLSRRALSLAGLPDPALFLYADDAIYTMTLTRRGGQMGFAPQIRFVHDSDSLGAGGVVRPLWKVYYYHRNRLLLYRLAAGAAFWLMLPLWLIQWPRQARHYAAEERVAFRRVLRRAVRDALRRDLSLPHAEVLRLAEGGER